MEPSESTRLLSYCDNEVCITLDICHILLYIKHKHESLISNLKFSKTLLYFQPGEPPQQTQYQVYGIRWLILILFVMYSTSNAFQWTQVRFFYETD